MESGERGIRRAVGLIAFAIVLFVGLWHIGTVLGAVRTALQMLSFFFVGLSIAFVLNRPMQLIETRLFAPLNRRFGRRWPRARRPAAVVLTLLLFLAVVFLVVFMVIPEIVRTTTLLANEIPGFLQEAGAYIDQLAKRYNLSLETLELIDIDWQEIGSGIVDLLRRGAGSILSGTFTAATSIVSGAVSFVIGLILAVYVLLSKERLASQVKRLLYACFRETRVDWLVKVGRRAQTIFGSFLGGQFLEAMILGAMCFVGMLIFGFQFAPMVSILVMVTAFIPIFGAFIGVTVGTFVILVNQGLGTAVWFVLFFLVLQQIEGNLIYPHVVGKSVMLPGLWVLVAVTLGGNVAGILGMFVSVPLCSLLYTLLREAVDARNAANGIAREKLIPVVVGVETAKPPGKPGGTGVKRVRRGTKKK